MKLIAFETSVIARTVDDRLLIALIDGAASGSTAHECVGLLTCDPETAQALCAGVGSTLKDATGQ